jgi:tRNA(Ile)-lysidine synthase
MASSRSSPTADDAERPRASKVAAGDARAGTVFRRADNAVIAAVRAALAAFAAQRAVPGHDSGLRVAVALSGGRDSMALLDALASLRPELEFGLSALHVHHGLSPNADRWAAFSAEECARRDIALTVHHVRIARAPGKSLEATARAARYAALRRADADVVMLAHHADDQAETLLLQLLRGAGPHGLAAMPAAHAGAGPALLRPWLALPGTAVEAFARERGVRWIDDESNADTELKRNYLRHEIGPRLAAAFPGYPATLVRAAAHNAEAAHLLDELAAIDARDADVDDNDVPTIDRAALIALAQRAPPRARNLLRWFLRRHALPLPSTARLGAMLDQLVHAAPDARVRLAHAGAELGIFRGRIVVHTPAVERFAIAWSGEPALALPHGVLEFAPTRGDGLATAALAAAAVTVRRREGGERMRLAADRRSRAVTRLLYDAGIAPWQRESLPFVYCGDVLAAVPGIGVDAAFRATGDAPGIVLRWHPGLP